MAYTGKLDYQGKEALRKAKLTAQEVEALIVEGLEKDGTLWSWFVNQYSIALELLSATMAKANLSSNVKMARYSYLHKCLFHLSVSLNNISGAMTPEGDKRAYKKRAYIEAGSALEEISHFIEELTQVP